MGWARRRTLAVFLLLLTLGAGSGSAEAAAEAGGISGEVPAVAGEGLDQAESSGQAAAGAHARPPLDYGSMLFVFVLATFVGVGVIRNVSRLLHTPLMSLTNAISAIAVVGSIVVTGAGYPPHIRLMGAIALFASMTNIVSGFLITDRMLKMFKRPEGGKR